MQTVNRVVYRSERFIISGNPNYRLVITDILMDKGYEIMRDSLKKYQRHFDKLKPANKDKFLLTLICSQVPVAA